MSVEFIKGRFPKDNKRFARIRGRLLSAVLKLNGLPDLSREDLLKKLEQAEFHEVSEAIKHWEKNSTGGYQGPRC